MLQMRFIKYLIIKTIKGIRMKYLKAAAVISLSSIIMACSTTPAPEVDSAADEATDIVESPAVDTTDVTEVETPDFDYSKLEQEDDLPEFEVSPLPEVDKAAAENERVEEALPRKSSDGKLILGHKEWVYFPSSKRWLVSKIDANQDISSISVSDVVLFERDGKKWVKFRVDHDDVSSELFSLPVQRTMKADSAFPKSPVVLAWVQVSELKEKTEFVLSDKSAMSHPLILGNSFYRDVAVLDESREFVQPKNVE